VCRVLDAAHHPRVVQGPPLHANVSLWIVNANVKHMTVEAPQGTAARARGR
jgi:hypothetical protein